MSNSVRPYGLQPASLLWPWDSPDKNTGMDCHTLLQAIFLIQGSNLGLPHCRRIIYCMSHQVSLWILEWVAYPFSRGSSPPRNGTRVSCIVGEFFTSWATQEAQLSTYENLKSKDLITKCSIIFLVYLPLTVLSLYIYIYREREREPSYTH